MSNFKQIIDNISNIENLDNTTILKILEKFDKELSKYIEKQSNLSNIINVDFIPLENGLTYSQGVADILGTLKFTLEDRIIEKPASVKLNIKGDSYIIVDSDVDGNAIIIREDDELYHKAESISNPNLLINGDFRVNQRGQTTYTATSSKWQYFVDRWRVYNSGNAFDTETKTITLKNNSTFEQTIEDYKAIAGKTVTLSAKITNITGLVQLFIAKGGVGQISTNNITTSGTYTFTATIDSNITSLRVGILSPSSSSEVTSVSVDYIKLEIGSVATAFSPRPYAEELAMCKRYYQKIYSRQISGVTNASATTSTLAYACINYEVEMRTVGTRKQINVLNISCQPRDTATTVYKQNNIGLYFSYVTTKGGWFAFKDFPSLPKATPFFVGGEAVSQDEVCLEIDAEIY